MLKDIRYGIRSLLKRPGLTAVVLLTLGLGIGVNTAIFSAVDSVLLRPLPLQNPDRLVAVWEHTPSLGIAQNHMAPANFFDLRQHNEVFEGLSAFSETSVNLTGTGEPEHLTGQLVSANVFSLLGVAPALGRAFSPDEDQIGRRQSANMCQGE